jgi:hypothetical protein
VEESRIVAQNQAMGVNRMAPFMKVMSVNNFSLRSLWSLDIRRARRSIQREMVNRFCFYLTDVCRMETRLQSLNRGYASNRSVTFIHAITFHPIWDANGHAACNRITKVRGKHVYGHNSRESEKEARDHIPTIELCTSKKESGLKSPHRNGDVTGNRRTHSYKSCEV